MYSVLNALSEYTYFYISKKSTSYTFLFLKSSKAFSVSLNTVLKVINNFLCNVGYHRVTNIKVSPGIFTSLQFKPSTYIFLLENA